VSKLASSHVLARTWQVREFASRAVDARYDEIHLSA